MNHLELFSGTHSFGKVSCSLGYNIVSLDRDLGAECPLKSAYTSAKHFQEDILTWNYKQYPKHYFKLITASPVCMWWSHLRRSWIGRKIKAHGDTIITAEILDRDIELYGIPMVDKIFEILDYFDPKYFIIENPKSGKMKNYINELIPFYDIDYCKYSDFGYKKTTRFWTNIEGLEFNKCYNNCEMKDYISDLIPYYDVDYCMYGFDYRKTTRFWTNIKSLEFNKCKHTKHNYALGHDSNMGLANKYKIPPEAIKKLLLNVL